MARFRNVKLGVFREYQNTKTFELHNFSEILCHIHI